MKIIISLKAKKQLLKHEIANIYNRCNMLVRTYGYFLFLFLLYNCNKFYLSARQQDETDCKKVYYHYCSFYGKKIPGDSVEGFIPDTGLSFSTVYENRKTTWAHVPNKTIDYGRVLCTNTKSAFKWVYYDPKRTDLRRPLRSVHTQRIFVTDSKLFGIVVRKKKGATYLKFHCRMQGREPSPKIPTKNKIFKWEDYNLRIPRNALEGGKDRHSKRSFYIGLTTYLNETFVVKIMRKTTWLQLVNNPMYNIYITSARGIKILTVDDREHVRWERLSEKDARAKGGIYRCEQVKEYIVTGQADLCGSYPVEKLTYFENIEFLS